MAEKIYIIAGELSGEIHGAELMRAVLLQQDSVEFYGYGGAGMAENGEVTDWLEDSAVMGVSEVLKKYTYFKEKLDLMLQEIIDLNPDAVIFIDYPKFNLILAERIRKNGLRTKLLYYISPKVWAWNKKRVPKMAALLDKMICIFPFEVEIYQKAGLEVEYVGNPLVDELGERGADDERQSNLVGLFPGSREREVERLLPSMLNAALLVKDKYPDAKFSIPSASKKLTEKIDNLLSLSGRLSSLDIAVTDGESHQLMRRAYCGVVASGTATLEAAWLGLPYCLIYKVSPLTYWMAKLLVKIRFIGLVNILAGKEVVKEYIQHEASALHISESINQMLGDAPHRESIVRGVIETADKLGKPGVHDRAAQAVLKTL